MKFLIYNDTMDDLDNLLEIVKVIHADLTTHNVDSCSDFLHHYNNNKYDVIIIKYFSNVWEKLLNEIINQNARQKIILLSDKFDCSQQNSCLTCQENHNINISINPIIESEIINLFAESSICEEYNRTKFEFSLLTINKKINLRFHSINLDLNKLTFAFNDISDNKKIVILTDLVSELKNEQIEYKVDDNLNVRIIQ